MVKKLNLFEIIRKKYTEIIIVLILSNIIIGSLYLVVLMDKIKANDYANRLNKENSQLNADISRIKLEIDREVDLATIELRATNELGMDMITEVEYIKNE